MHRGWLVYRDSKAGRGLKALKVDRVLLQQVLLGLQVGLVFKAWLDFRVFRGPLVFRVRKEDRVQHPQVPLARLVGKVLQV